MFGPWRSLIDLYFLSQIIWNIKTISQNHKLENILSKKPDICVKIYPNLFTEHPPPPPGPPWLGSGCKTCQRSCAKVLECLSARQCSWSRRAGLCTVAGRRQTLDQPQVVSSKGTTEYISISNCKLIAELRFDNPDTKLRFDNLHT